MHLLKKIEFTPHLIMCLIGFSYIASLSVISPILSIYVKDIVMAPIEIVGLVTAMFFVASSSTDILLGIFAGGKKTITFLLFIFIIFTICPALYPLTNNIIALIILRAIQGFAYASIGTASIILAALTISSTERDKGVGTYTASLSLGFLAGPAITTFSIPLLGVANTFYFASLMGCIGTFAAFFLRRKLLSIEREWRVLDFSVNGEPTISKFSTIVRNRMFCVAFLGSFAFFVLFGVILAYAPIYAKKELNFTDGTVPILFLFYYIATTITRLSIGRIVKNGKVSKPTIMVIGTAFAALFSLTIVFFKNNLIFAGILALIGAVQGVTFPVGSMLIADHIEPSRNVLASSLYMMSTDVGQAIAPLITASIVSQFGLEYGFIVPAAISAVIAVALIWLITSNRPKITSQTSKKV